MAVAFTDDPRCVLAEAGAFLASEPVLHNVILTLLAERAAHPQPGRYWTAREGVVFQSPLHLPATLTPLRPGDVEAFVDAVAAECPGLPGVNGEAASAARFAGQWTERTRTPAKAVHGQRLYEAREVREPRGVAGGLRPAGAADRPALLEWARDFAAEIGDSATDPAAALERRGFWIWEAEGGPAAMAAQSDPVGDVVRVQYVFTPAALRGRGFASACVGALSRRILEARQRPILYADLANPTSNSIYRRLGYRTVAEVLGYRFG